MNLSKTAKTSNCVTDQCHFGDTSGHKRTAYGNLGNFVELNCVGLPPVSVMAAVCKVILSAKKGRLRVSHPPKQVCFMCFFVTYPMPRARHLPKSNSHRSRKPARCIPPAIRSQSIDRVWDV